MGWRTDICWLRALLYGMLTGNPHFPIEGTAMLVHSIVYGRPQNPSEVNTEISEEISRVFMKAPSKSEERYNSVDLIIEVLKR
ncbi:MAG: hypothetical protein QXR19_14430 [Candidatus Jordarchaeaceae archaeon]